MLPSDIADLELDKALAQNRPPDVARYYALLAALDAVFLNINHNNDLTHDLAGRLGVKLPWRRTDAGEVEYQEPGEPLPAVETEQKP